MPHEYRSRGSVQRKHPTKATKLQLLEFLASFRGAEIVTVAQRFRLSESGARCKLWRLKKQSFVEAIPDTYGRTKAWQLTSAGRRYLAYLREAEDYGGTKGLLISNLKSEVALLKAENDNMRKIIEDRHGFFQKAVDQANKKLALERTMATANTEIERLRAENEAMRAAIAHRYRR
jgi:predicted ArsR family transcriptional regulator